LQSRRPIAIFGYRLGLKWIIEVTNHKYPTNMNPYRHTVPT